ncbi:MAG: LuxR family transcriptional regulator, partial [Deltaproteobacteria bacterium]|nr:LuxR family transcriptional regulator [Deltaproteobacteria bacterium]
DRAGNPRAARGRRRHVVLPERACRGLGLSPRPLHGLVSLRGRAGGLPRLRAASIRVLQPDSPRGPSAQSNDRGDRDGEPHRARRVRIDTDLSEGVRAPQDGAPPPAADPDLRRAVRRLSVERRLADGGLATAALEAAIEHTGSPSFVVSRTGRLLAANASGRELLEQDRATTRELLALAARGRAHASFELVPLREPGTAAAWLVLMRVSTAEQSIARCEATAAERWTLTPRQRSVLKLLIGGDSNARIAASLGIGERAVELHVTALLDRAGLDGRAALVACVLSMRR